MPLFGNSTANVCVLGTSSGRRWTLFGPTGRGDKSMKRATLAIATLMMLAACSPQPAEEAQVEDVASTAPVGAEAAGCFAEASRDWSAVGSQYYVVEAEARGATCREAVATVRISSQQGAKL